VIPKTFAGTYLEDFLDLPYGGSVVRAKRRSKNSDQQNHSHRAIVLNAMSGMRKTALATEAAHWWTRSGLFRDGACFISF